MKYIYLGDFPPPYGGVTVKNLTLYHELSKYIQIEQSHYFDKKKRIVKRVSSLVTTALTHNYALVIGLSKNSLLKITSILYYINKKLMNRSIVMVMGGTIHHDIGQNKGLVNKFRQYKHIFVETNGMSEVLQSVGLRNVSVYPNCRKRPKSLKILNRNSNQLRCIFISNITPAKGVDLVIDATKKIISLKEDYIIDFYGHISSDYEEKFISEIKNDQKLKYCGVFKSQKANDIYEKLKQYDVLLLPTKWKNEGVPGILVESKIAGITAIVSDINFNSEIICDCVDGIVLEKNTSSELAKAIEVLMKDRNYLYKLKKNAILSSEKYILENHVESIIKLLKS